MDLWTLNDRKRKEKVNCPALMIGEERDKCFQEKKRLEKEIELKMRTRDECGEGKDSESRKNKGTIMDEWNWGSLGYLEYPTLIVKK